MSPYELKESGPLSHYMLMDGIANLQFDLFSLVVLLFAIMAGVPRASNYLGSAEVMMHVQSCGELLA